VHHGKHLEHRRRHGHRAIDAALALLQRLERDRLGGEVDELGVQLQRLGDPAPRVGEDVAKGADQAVLVVGRGV
jgi:hypothetical protein